ncbi:MAG: N-acetylmuramic acid 6-phosphate etherase [Phycisphaerales bacterium]|nr:N-acetylmuramic acid 6-phosphate etherase [Phycisphaerales bacterium]
MPSTPRPPHPTSDTRYPISRIPDRSHILTEQRNPRSMNLHELSVADCVALINREDRAVLDALDAARPAITAFLEQAEPRWLAGGRLIYLGAGTSGRLGVLDASECPPTFQTPPERVIGFIAGGDTALRKSSEGKEDDPAGAHAELRALNLTPDDILVGIAAGGTTPYVLGALEGCHHSPRSGALVKGETALTSHPDTPSPPHPDTPAPLTALITCSPIPRPLGVDHLIVLETGPEVVTGSTRMKAGTATKLALNTISTTLMIRSGRVYENLMVDLRASNAKLRDRAARVISTLTGLPRDQAFALLDRAGGSVKTAAVMHAARTDRADAERRLADVRGRLADALSVP